MSRTIVIVRTGTANLASVRAAFERQGHTVELTEEPARVAEADRVVLPGVGAFGASMAELVKKNLAEPLVERARGNRSLLAICVGMQLLCRGSTESPGARGLEVVNAEVSRFDAPGLRVPQLGWNDVTAPPEARFVRSGVAYFANSYRARQVADGWVASTADHGGTFVAAMERGNVLACQFHPELSGAWGAQLLARWIEGSG
ncbi:MAG: imidazole glycerol phosphate synthase subunit HisH [Myxococcota bacterium]